MLGKLPRFQADTPTMLFDNPIPGKFSGHA